MADYWRALLVGQLEFYWDVHLRPRLDGLTDEEYLWEPVEGCWSVRLDAEGRYVLDGKGQDLTPAPVTTIAWRMMHLAAPSFGSRVAAFFGPDAGADADMFDPRYEPSHLPGSADGGIAFLEEAYRAWCAGVSALDDAALKKPLGPTGGPYANDSMAELVLHVSRELMHHGGEIGVLRDLYRATGARDRNDTLHVGA